MRLHGLEAMSGKTCNYTPLGGENAKFLRTFGGLNNNSVNRVLYLVLVNLGSILCILPWFHLMAFQGVPPEGQPFGGM